MADEVTLDHAVDQALADPSAIEDPLVRLLMDAHRSEPSPALARRVGAAISSAERGRWLPARAAAAVLAATFLVEATGDLFLGRWLARHLDTAYDAHTLFEGGVVFLALAGVLIAAALAARWLDLAAAAGVPVGLALAVHGLPELGEFPGGGLLHVAQGLAAAALAACWLRARRYGPPSRPNTGHER